jgi:hypothetical protein
MLMPAAEAASVPCTSWSELVGYLSEVVAGNYRASPAARRSIDEVVTGCCHAADGRSYRRASDAIERILRFVGTTDSMLCRRALYQLDGPATGALADAGRHVRHRLALSPEWSFARMREIPAVEWTSSRKHFDAAQVRRLVDRACQCGPFATTGGDIEVSAGGGDQGRHTRYGVTIAPRNSLRAPQRIPDRLAQVTDARALS